MSTVQLTTTETTPTSTLTSTPTVNYTIWT